MFWILGLHSALESLLKAFAPQSGITQALCTQFTHVGWEGFHFYDLIFPLFVFLAGVSSAIALPRRVERDGMPSAVCHIAQRGALLFALGVFYNGGLERGLEHVRWMGVLQRIGIASACAGFLSLRLSNRMLAVVCGGILLGYALPFYWIPVPGTGVTGFAEGNNIANYVDSICLPGRLHAKTWDPEGLLSTLPAVATALIGVLAGRWITSEPCPRAVLRGLALGGIILLGAGFLWSPFFPIIKKIWTSSFVLWSAGWSALLLAAFYGLMDLGGFRWWATPFLWIGSNPLLLYLLSGLGFFRGIASRLVPKNAVDAPWLLPLLTVGTLVVFARWLYRNKIVVRI
jgi:predicted acyltransferase